jgi:glutathione synthase/RimK-type ligase-like ATP-grasp enzyme
MLDRPGVYWVNRPDAESAAALKLFQLRKAKEAGLTIPDTLVSNDPPEIKDFIRQCSGRTVFKFQETATWKKDEA